MARVTVEDCIQKVKNRFELVLMASRRAKDLERGARPTVMRDNDKSTIIALREIAEETISLEGLEKLTKKGLLDEGEEQTDIFQNNDDIDLTTEDEEDDSDDLVDEDTHV